MGDAEAQTVSAVCAGVRPRMLAHHGRTRGETLLDRHLRADYRSRLRYAGGDCGSTEDDECCARADDAHGTATAANANARSAAHAGWYASRWPWECPTSPARRARRTPSTAGPVATGSV